jgi:hypothetical protein
LRRSRCVRREPRDCRDEPVTAPRHGRDDGLLAVTDGLTNLADAMCQGLVGYHDVRPDRLDQFFLGHQAIRILHEIAQHLEAFRAQSNFAIRGSQRATGDVQRIALEFEHAERRGPWPDQDNLMGQDFSQTTAFVSEITRFCQDGRSRFASR